MTESHSSIRKSDFELEAELRKELGLSAWGMVEHQEIPWQIRIILELLSKKSHSGAKAR